MDKYIAISVGLQYIGRKRPLVRLFRSVDMD